MEKKGENTDETWLLREKYAGIPSADFEADRKKLTEGVPLAYLIGHIPFLNTTIYLDSHPLIPRPETEYWVARAIREISSSMPNIESLNRVRVLDLCAGSGCIGVAILKALPNAHVDFAEIITEHHATIEKNIKENDIDLSRTHTYGGDLFSEIPLEQYAYIFSNPPYIDPALSERTEKNVTEHEPKEALWGGEKGLEYIKRIIQEGKKYLSPSGILYIEHEPEQTDTIASYAHANGYRSILSEKDQYGITRTTQFRLT